LHLTALPTATTLPHEHTLDFSVPAQSFPLLVSVLLGILVENAANRDSSGSFQNKQNEVNSGIPREQLIEGVGSKWHAIM
jgi:hypothetical protein